MPPPPQSWRTSYLFIHVYIIYTRTMTVYTSYVSLNATAATATSHRGGPTGFAVKVNLLQDEIIPKRFDGLPPSVPPLVSRLPEPHRFCGTHVAPRLYIIISCTQNSPGRAALIRLSSHSSSSPSSSPSPVAVLASRPPCIIHEYLNIYITYLCKESGGQKLPLVVSTDKLTETSPFPIIISW